MSVIKYIPFLTFLLFLGGHSLLFAQILSSESLPKSINSGYQEVLPIISPDGNTLYFVRANHPQNTHGAENSQDIWFSKKDLSTGNWQPARHMGSPFNRQYYNAVYSVSPDGNRLLIEGAYRNGRYIGRGVSVSYFKGGIWRQPNELKVKNYENMAKGKFSTASLSADGNVLLLSFSKKKSGPKSELGDLYVSIKEEGENYSEPRSLGQIINGNNTNEFSPFLAADGKTLYFASDREGGLGSTDIYKTTRLDKSWENWSEPVNLGEKVNTAQYDAYYSIAASAEEAFMITYAGDGNTDIIRVKLEVTDKPEPVVLLKGTIEDVNSGQKLDGIIFWELEEGGQSASVGEDKTFSAVFAYGNKYKYTVLSEGYEPIEQVLDLRRKGKYEEITRNFKLKPLEGEEGIATNVLGNGNEGSVNSSKLNGANDSDELANNNGGTANVGNGSGNNNLSNANGLNGSGTNATSLGGRNGQFSNEQEGGLSDAELVKILEERRKMREKDKRFKEVTVKDLGTLAVFFEYNKSYLDAAYYAELNGLAKLLKEIPKIRLFVKGHTDDQGSEGYNEELSRARAEEVKAYLVGQGIEEDRLIVRPMGEKAPVYSNETRMDRAINRRVDFGNATGRSSGRSENSSSRRGNKKVSAREGR